MARIRLTDEQIAKFMADLQFAERRIEADQLPLWQRITKSYEGRGRDEILGVGSFDPKAVNFNFLLSTANTVIPSILSEDPYVEFRSRTPMDEQCASTAEAGVNYAYVHGHANAAVHDVLVDTLLYSAGIGKVVFNPAGNVVPVLHYDQDAHIDLEPDGDDDDDDLKAMIDEEMGEIGMLPMEMDDGIDIPTLERVAPWNFLFPEGYDDINKCPWVAHKMLVRVEDLRMYPGFRVAPGITANESVMSPAANWIGATADYSASQEPSFVTLYEMHYWVRKGKRLVRRIVWLLENSTAHGFDRVVRHIEDDSGMRGYPFVMLRMSRLPGKMYEARIADLATIQPIADRLNDELRNVLRHHELSSKQKYACAPGSLSGDSSFGDMLASAEDMVAAELPSQLQDVRSAVQLVQIAPMPPDVPFILNLLQRMMYEIGGVDVFQRGGVARKGTTATEVAVASQAFQDRANVRRRQVQKFVEDVARRYLDCMRRYWTTPVWIRSASGGGDDEYLEITAEKMGGLFDIRAHVSEFDPDEQRNQLQAFNGLLQTVGNLSATWTPLVQAGVMPAESIPNLVDHAFRLWKQDKRRLVGSLTQMANGLTSTPASPGASLEPAPEGGAPAAPGEDPAAAQVDGNGFSPLATRLSLAGTGPRPRPGQGVEETG